MKKLTNADILTILQVLNDDIGKELLTKKIPVKISFAIKHNMEVISEAYKTYESTLKELAKTYNAELTKTGVKAKTQEEQVKLNEELTNLLQEEVELNLKLVPMEVFDKCGEGHYDALSFGELERLNWLMEEEEEENKE